MMNSEISKVDIVVVSYNTRDLLEKCLRSCDKHARAARVFVVDNASGDGSAKMVEEKFPRVTLTALKENIGFGPANNVGLAQGRGPFVLCLNPDAELTEGALEELIEELYEHRDCAIVGPMLHNPDGTFQLSCRRLPTVLRNFWVYAGMTARYPDRFQWLHSWLTEEEHRHALEVGMVSGACFLTRRVYLETVGHFDEDLFMYEEEMDLCLPAYRRGMSVRYCRDAVVIHHGGASTDNTGASDFSLRQMFRSKYVAFRKHYGSFWSRVTFWSDRFVFDFSAWLNRMRGRESEATHMLKIVERAWREAQIPLYRLRATPSFFKDDEGE
jgi:hypothetical protein